MTNLRMLAGVPAIAVAVLVLVACKTTPEPKRAEATSSPEPALEQAVASPQTEEQATTTPPAMASCNPSSKEEFVKLLTQLSPFEGRWHWNNKTGPVRATFDATAGVPHILWRSSGPNTGLGPEKGYILTSFTRSEVTFNTGSDTGEIRLRISDKCMLGGLQYHPNGTARIEATPTNSNRLRDTTAAAAFSSKEELTEFLTQGSPFNGGWSWGTKSGSGSTTFTNDGGMLRAEDEDGAVPVTLLSPTQLRYTLPGDSGTVQLEAKQDGTLIGIQIYDNIHAVQLEMIASSQQFTGN